METVLFVLVLVGIALSVVYWSWRNGIVPMPTAGKVKRALFERALPAHVNGVIYELGAGWGTLAIPLAKRYPQYKVIGYETSPVPYAVCKLRQWLSFQKNLEIKRQDFFEISLDDAGLVVCYLYPGAMRLLKDKFHKEMKEGTWIVSHTFSLPGWTPVKTVEVDDLYRSKIYVYQITHIR